MNRESLLSLLRKLYDIADINNISFLQLLCYVNYCNNSILQNTDEKINILISLIYDKLYEQIGNIASIESPKEQKDGYKSLSSEFLDAQVENQQGYGFRRGR